MGDENRKNVIVVGAGASKEFGLPTGEELAEKIGDFCRLGMDDFGNITRGNIILRRIIGPLAARSGVANQLKIYFSASNQIANNMPLAPSIDTFMDTRREEPLIVEIGKYAIAACIFGCRKKFCYFPERQQYLFDPGF